MARWQEALATAPDNAALFELMAQASMAVYEDFNAIQVGCLAAVENEGRWSYCIVWLCVRAQYASKATQLSPEWGDAFHTLARSHLNFGELSLALDNLNKVSHRHSSVCHQGKHELICRF
jgi:hypothetical protein